MSAPPRRLPIPPAASRAYRVGGVAVEPPVAMAPMADVTDVHFHEILRDVGGPGLYMAEMVSSTALARGNDKSERMLSRPAGCPAFGVQVFGNVPEDMATAAVMAAERGADLVDVNMGCPAKKITGNACGSSLLRDLPLVARILGTMRKRLPASIPLTVKIRTGWDQSSLSFVEVGRIAEGEGLAAVTLHGRTRAQMFDGRADWATIAALKSAIGIPVVGNGDVLTPEDAVRMLAETGCDGVMVARAALSNPWIFRQLRQAFAGELVTEPTLEERRRVILEHHDRLAAILPEAQALHRVRKFVGYYTKGVESGGDLRKRLNELRDGVTFRAAVDEFFSQLLAAAA